MWNYRIIKNKKDYGLYEVFYNEDGEICAHSENPEIVGENPREIFDSLSLMLKDVKLHLDGEKDVLDINKIKFAKWTDDDQEFFEFDIEDLK